jgi:hypothetical protein
VDVMADWIWSDQDVEVVQRRDAGCGAASDDRASTSLTRACRKWWIAPDWRSTPRLQASAVNARKFHGRRPRTGNQNRTKSSHWPHRGPGTRCGIYAHFPTSGYSMSIRNFVVDLRSTDVAIVRPTGVHGCDNDIEMTPEFPYMVHSVEPEQFVVNLDYGDEDVTWVAVLDWLLDGKSEELRIDNAGEPFVSTSFCTRPIYTLECSDWKWHLRSQTFKEKCHPFRRR